MQPFRPDALYCAVYGTYKSDLTEHISAYLVEGSSPSGLKGLVKAKLQHVPILKENPEQIPQIMDEGTSRGGFPAKIQGLGVPPGENSSGKDGSRRKI